VCYVLHVTIKLNVKIFQKRAALRNTTGLRSIKAELPDSFLERYF